MKHYFLTSLLLLSSIGLNACQSNPAKLTSPEKMPHRIIISNQQPVTINELMENTWWLVSITDNNQQVIDLEKIHKQPVKAYLDVRPNNGGYQHLTTQPYLMDFIFGCNSFSTGMALTNNEIIFENRNTISTAMSCGETINALDDQLKNALLNTQHISFDRQANLLTFLTSNNYKFVWRPYKWQALPDFNKIQKYEWRLMSAKDGQNQPITELDNKNFTTQERLTTRLYFTPNKIIYSVGCNTLSQSISKTQTGFTAETPITTEHKYCDTLDSREKLLIEKMQGYSELRWTENPTDEAVLLQTTQDESKFIWRGKLKK